MMNLLSEPRVDQHNYNNVVENKSFSEGVLHGEGNYDLKVISDLLSKGLKEVKKVQGQRLVLMLGNSGAGKSTLINHCIGIPLRLARKDGDVVVIPKQSDATYDAGKMAKIGHKATGETLIPKVYPGGDGFVFCDLPGFFDNRSEESRICASYLTEALIKGSAEVLIIVVIAKDEFKTMRGSAFIQLSETLSKLFKNIQNMAGSILFVMSKTDQSGVFSFEEGDITKLIGKQWKALELKLSVFRKQYREGHNMSEQRKRNFEDNQKIFQIVDVMYRSIFRTYTGSLENTDGKDRIIGYLNQLEYTSKESFAFDRYDKDRKHFDELVEKMSLEGHSILNELKHLVSMIKAHKEFEDANCKALETWSEAIEANHKGGNDAISRVITKAESEQAGLKRREEDLKNQKDVLVAEQKELDSKIATLGNGSKKEAGHHIYEERHKFGFWGWTSTILEYTGLPYKEIQVVKKTDNEQPIPSSQLDELKNENEEGVYRVRYESEFFKPGDAQLLITYDRKVYYKDQIDTLNRELKCSNTMFDHIGDLITGNSETIKKSKDLIKDHKNKSKNFMKSLASEKARLTGEIKKSEQFICELKARKKKVEQHLSRNKILFNILKNLNSMLSFKSNIVQDFFREFSECPQSNDEFLVAPEGVDGRAYEDPISLEIMTNPVTAPCGHSFDKASILSYLENSENEECCAVCSVPLTAEQLVPNLYMRRQIDVFRRKITKNTSVFSFIDNSPISVLRAQLEECELQRSDLNKSLHKCKVYISLLKEKIEKLDMAECNDQADVEEQKNTFCTSKSSTKIGFFATADVSQDVEEDSSNKNSNNMLDVD